MVSQDVQGREFIFVELRPYINPRQRLHHIRGEFRAGLHNYAVGLGNREIAHGRLHLDRDNRLRDNRLWGNRFGLLHSGLHRGLGYGRSLRGRLIIIRIIAGFTAGISLDVSPCECLPGFLPGRLLLSVRNAHAPEPLGESATGEIQPQYAEEQKDTECHRHIDKILEPEYDLRSALSAKSSSETGFHT